MATQIFCINKTNRYDAHDRIHSVGGSEMGIRWKKPQQQVVLEIKLSGAQYYVNQGGKAVWVIVATRLGKDYLKTENDGEQPNNLLSLPECP